MIRFKDKYFLQLSSYSVALNDFISVKCPSCSMEARLKIIEQGEDWISSYAEIFCPACAFKRQKSVWKSSVSVTAFCNYCMCHFKLNIDEKYEKFTTIDAQCPKCNNIAKNGKITTNQSSRNFEIITKSGRDIYFNTEAYFISNFRENTLWALNRNHLKYLIDYVQADLREGHNHNGYPLKTQDHSLPKFIKSAKNRDALTKTLIKMATDN